MKGNEPAFPDPMRGAEPNIINQSPQSLPAGLTKREYFAALAMQGLIGMYHRYEEGGDGTINLCADAVGFADNLLKQLER